MMVSSALGLIPVSDIISVNCLLSNCAIKTVSPFLRKPMGRELNDSLYCVKGSAVSFGSISSLSYYPVFLRLCPSSSKVKEHRQL